MAKNNSDGEITLSLAIKKTLANIQSGLKQISDSLFVNVTGKLNKSKTKSQIKQDLNSLNADFKVVGKLDKAATKKKIKSDIKSLKDTATIDVKAKIDTKDLKTKLKNLKTKSVKVESNVDGAKAFDKVAEGMDSINKKSVSTVANINLVNRAINGIEQAARKMIQTSATLNEKLTDTRMVTGKNYEEAEKLVHIYNSLAKELGSTTVEVLDASSEWLRQGKSEAETGELIKQSMILSKVGAMDSASATDRLTSAMNGYKLSVQDASGIVDKFTAVDMAAAVSTDELAEALSHTASSAYLAGVDIDKILAYITVVEETTRKSASVVGESFKTIFARMGKVTNGDAVDDMGEDISKVEATLRGLGIELRDSVSEFKDFDIVLDEVGKKWKSFSSVKQREIATAFGGVYQSENFIALMNNYDKVAKYVDIAANSAGTASEKFEAYQESVKAHANEFLAVAESLSMNSIPADFMNAIISAGTALLEFIDNTHLLQLTLNNLVAVGAVKGFSFIGTKIKEVTQSVKQLTSAFDILDTSNTILSTSEFEKLLSVTKGLSESQLRLVISSKSLTTQQRMAILTANGLSTEEAEATIAALGLATAEGAATTATFSLSGALKALKAAFLSNPIGIIAVALTTLISLITMGVDKIKQAKEEARQAAIDSANAAADSSNEITDLTNKYAQLSEEVKTNASVKDSLKETEDSLIDKLGLEGSKIDELIKKYGNYADAIKAASIEKLQEDERDLRGGLPAKAEVALEKAEPEGLADKGMNHLITTWSKEQTEINHKALNALVDAGYISSGSFGSRGMELWLTDMDLSTIDGVIAAHKQLGDMLDIIQDAAGSNNEVYKELYTRYNNCSESIKDYQNGISDLNRNLAQQYTMQELIGREVPKTQKEFDEYRNSVIESAKASGEFEGSAEDIANAIDLVLSSNSQFTDFVKKLDSPETDTSTLDAKIKAYNDLTEQILSCNDAQEKNKLIAEQNALGKEIEDIAKLTSQYDDLTAAYENWQKAQSSENEGSRYDSITKGLEEIQKTYNEGLIGTDDFKAAVQLMSNQDLTNATPEQLKNAYELSYPSMQKYFKDGSEGCQRFLTDVSKLNSEWAHLNENGDWEINFKDEEVAEKLGISIGAIQAIMLKLREFGFDINISTALESLANLKGAIETANDKLKELNKTEIDFDVNSTNVDDLINQIDSASQIFDTFKKEDGTIDLSVEGAQEAKTILAALIMQKQQVSEPAIIEFNFNAETAKSEIESAALLINDFRTKYRELEVKIATGEDTSELQKEIQGIVTQIDKVPNEVKTSLGLDTDEFNTAVDTLTSKTVDVKAGVTLDADALAAFNANLLGITPSLLVKAGLDDTLIKNYNPDDAYEKIGTVKYKVDDTLVEQYNPKDLHRTVYYKVQEEGTAKAQGQWGATESGIALGGELGQELVVRNGKFFTIGDDGAEFFNYKKDDIIFNAEQTKQIFEKGKITSGNRRGRALAEGTAFDGGTTTGIGRFPINSNGTTSSKTSANSSKKSSTTSDSPTSSKSSSKKSDEETEFERQYKYHQHLLAMDQESTQAYLDWLVNAYKEAYSAGQIELDDFYKYEEEVYDKSKTIFSNLIKDSEHAIEMWGNQGGHSQDIINEYRAMQEAVHDQAEYYRSLGLSEDNDLIQDLQKQWWDYSKKITDTIKDTYDEIVRSIEDSIDLSEEHLKEFVNVYDDGSTENFSKSIAEKYFNIQNNLHDEAEILRALGYSEDSKEIQDLQKQWWDAEHNKNSSLKDIFDRRLELSEDYIERSKVLGWENGDNEIKARERILKWLSSDYYRSLCEDEEEWQEEYLEQLKNYNSTVISTIDKIYDNYSDAINKVNDEIDEQISKEQGLLDIKNKQYEAINKLSEAQHNADKAIATSRISKAYLSPAEYERIYNEEDYRAISNIIDDIDYDISRLTSNFNKQIENAYANGQEYLIENITAEYERQVELKMQELNIAQAELEVTKKQTELNNILQERNIRQIVEKNGKLQWEWVADADKVREATEALSDAEYEQQKAINEKNQQINLNRMQENIDDFTDEQKRNNKLVEQLGNTIDDIKKTIDDIENPIEGLTIDVKNLKEKGVVNFSKAIDSMVEKLGSIAINSSSTAKSTVSKSSGGTSYGSGGGSSKVTYDKDVDYMAQAQSAIKSGDYASAQKAIDKRNAKIDGEGLSYAKQSLSDVKKSMGYAGGTTNATKGLHEIEENGDETYITSDGKFHNFSGGEIVFDHDQTKELYNLASKLTVLSNGTAKTPLFPFKGNVANTSNALQGQNNNTQNNNYSFGDIVVNNPSDYNAFTRELIKTIKEKTV